MLCVVLLSYMSFTGCSALSTRTSENTSSGELLILGSAEEEYVRGMARAFQLETGITTDYVRLSTGQALDALRADRADPTFSVWWGGPADVYIAGDAEGLLDTYRPRGAAKIPRQYKDEDGNWTGIYVGVLGLAVNTRVLADKGLPEPTSWADLTNPIYRGLISVAHPATSGTAFNMVATVMQLNNKDADAGFAYLQALAKNVQKFERAGAEPARVVGRGDAAIAIVFTHDAIATIEDGATDLKVTIPAEGTGYEIGAMALVKNAPNTAEGRRFMDWALSDRAQELGPIFTAYQIPTNPDAKVPKQSVRLSSIKTIDYDFAWAGQNRQALVDRFSATVAPAPPPLPPSLPPPTPSPGP
jgi:iron(III) transport system substrate-binding protein